MPLFKGPTPFSFSCFLLPLPPRRLRCPCRLIWRCSGTWGRSNGLPLHTRSQIGRGPWMLTKRLPMTSWTRTVSVPTAVYRWMVTSR